MTQPLIRGNKEGIPRMIFGSDGTDWIAALIDGLGHLKVDVEAAALPTGAATQATLALCLTALQSLQNLVGALHDVGVDELDVQVLASVLPAGAATQTTLAATLTALQSIQNLVGALHDVGVDELDVQVIASALPAGAATEASLEAVETAVEIIDDFADPDNVIFGYKDRYLETVNATSTNGSTYINGSEVPAGEIWVITHVGVYHNDPAARTLLLYIRFDTADMRLAREPSQPQHEPMHFQGNWILKEGDKMRAGCLALATGKKVYMVCNGYKMSI